MLNELERFYNIVESNDRFNKWIRNSEEKPWIEIYDDEKNNLILGITQDGKWILKQATQSYDLNDKKNFLYCTSILETPFLKIKTKLKDRFKEIIEKEDIDIKLIFPLKTVYCSQSVQCIVLSDS